MKRFLIACIIFAICPAVANAVYTIGTPAPPTPSPLFGTWVDFDDQPTGTPVLWNDYVSVGVSSITEVTGGTLSRYVGTQSGINYVGTGFGYEIGGAVMGWDGTVRIDLALPASQIGLGIADSQGGPEFISVYDSGGNLLESYQVQNGLNVYAVITRATYDISRIELTGDFWAIDDLQFNAIPAPGAILLGSIGVGLVGWLRRRRTL